MGYVVIAPVGDNLKALFIGMKEFPTEKVILITPKNMLKAARKLAKKLDGFAIETEIMEIGEGLMSEMFAAFGRIMSNYPEEKLIVNVSTGDRMSTCAALSAAYANGLKAFGVRGNQPMLLPIMKLSYYEQLSASKLRILGELGADSYVSLKELGKRLGMSSSLLYYHVNGNFKYRGLREFRLVEIKEERRNQYIRLSTMGDLLVRGYIERENPIR